MGNTIARSPTCGMLRCRGYEMHGAPAEQEPSLIGVVMVWGQLIARIRRTTNTATAIRHRGFNPAQLKLWLRTPTLTATI